MMRFSVNRLARFSSADPLSGSTSNPQSLNHYTYALNDAVNLADPSGLGPVAYFPALSGITFAFWALDVFINGAEAAQDLGAFWAESSDPENPYAEEVGATNLNQGVLGLISPPSDACAGALSMGCLLNQAIQKALEALQKPKCRDLFADNVDPTALLQNLAAGGGLGNIQVDDLTEPTVSAQTSPILPANYSNQSSMGTTFAGANITVNSSPLAPFSFGFGTTASYGLDDTSRQAVTLLHELGHAANFIYGQGASTIANNEEGNQRFMSQVNSFVVAKNCF
jgi:hypothetical protein